MFRSGYSDFLKGTLTLLSDQKTYKKLAKDPALSLECKMNAMLLCIKKAGSIPDRHFDRLQSSAGRLQLLYGLPNIHKREVPLRPIISFVHCPTSCPNTWPDLGSVNQQTFGTAMGSPVLVMVANLIMEDVEERSLATVEVKPMFWKRYVDDTCTALPVDKVQEFLDHLNSIQPSIRFTMEVESNDIFPFLDVLLQCDSDGSISTTTSLYKAHAYG